MAEGLSVGGLASGLDTNSIISGLVAIEQGRVKREEDKKSDYELKLTTFNELKSKLEDFYKKSQTLDKTTAFDIFTGTSSDEAVATITGETGAAAGNYDLKVLGLATSLKVASKTHTQAQAYTNALGYTGDFKISTSAAALKADPTVTDVTVTLDGSETLKDIAAKINAAKGTGATASIVKLGNDDYRLMLTGVDEGSKGFTLDPVAGQETLGLLSDGLGLVTSGAANQPKESIRTTWDLKLAAGGPAAATSTFAQLFNGLGTGKSITAGDTISITGTMADGTAAAATTFTIGDSAWTLQRLLTTGTDGAGANSIAAAFGGAANVDVTMNSSGEIVVTDKTNGTTTMRLNLSFTDTDASGSALAMGAAATDSAARTAFANVISEGKKAFYNMNDIPMSSQTNKDNNTVPGTVFELKRADTTQTVKLQLTYDREGIKKKVQEFLDGYNQLIKFLDEKSKVEIKKNTTQTPFGEQEAKGTKIVKGPFAGDSSILSLKSQLQSLLTNKIDELESQSLSKYASFASMGITSEQKTGFLTIDQEKFDKALDTDMEGVRRLFNTSGYMSNGAHTFGTYTKETKTGVYAYDKDAGTFDGDKDAGTSSMSAGQVSGAGDILNSITGDSTGLAVKAASGSGTVTFVRGVAGQVKLFYEKITDFVGGFMTDTGKGIQKRIDDTESRIDRLEKQVARYKDRLTKQFAGLEMSMSKLQSQSSAFQSQIGSIRR